MKQLGIPLFFASQKFDDVEAAFFFALFLAREILAPCFLGEAVGVGSGLLNSLLAGRTVDACIDKLAAAAARIGNPAAHGELTTLNHLRGNRQRCTGFLDDIASSAVGISFYEIPDFFFIVSVCIITFLTGPGAGICVQLATDGTVFQHGAVFAIVCLHGNHPFLSNRGQCFPASGLLNTL